MSATDKWQVTKADKRRRVDWPAGFVAASIDEVLFALGMCTPEET
jgi:hypothetical protein